MSLLLLLPLLLVLAYSPASESTHLMPRDTPRAMNFDSVPSKQAVAPSG